MNKNEEQRKKENEGVKRTKKGKKEGRKDKEIKRGNR